MCVDDKSINELENYKKNMIPWKADEDSEHIGEQASTVFPPWNQHHALRCQWGDAQEEDLPGRWNSIVWYLQGVYCAENSKTNLGWSELDNF